MEQDMFKAGLFVIKFIIRDDYDYSQYYNQEKAGRNLESNLLFLSDQSIDRTQLKDGYICTPDIEDENLSMPYGVVKTNIIFKVSKNQYLVVRLFEFGLSAEGLETEEDLKNKLSRCFTNNDEIIESSILSLQLKAGQK